MVKQTKKGSIGKKALSAILAASMIMTSSSFVMAGPVVEEVEAVAVEEVAADETLTDASLLDEHFTLGDGLFTSVADVVEELNELKVQRKDHAEDQENFKAYVTNPTYYSVTVSGGELEEPQKVTENNGSYNLPEALGDYKITIKGIVPENEANNGWFAEGETTISYSIVSDNKQAASVTFDPVTYNGKALSPSITSFTIGGKALVEGEDYNVLGYYNNINACKKITNPAKVTDGAYITVEYIGAYRTRPDENISFAINQASLSTAKVTVNSPKFNGAVQLPTVKVEYRPSASDAYAELVQDTDYTVTVKEGTTVTEKPEEAGDYTVEISGKNNYTGTKTVTYKIQKQDFTTSTVTIEPLVVEYTGDGKTYSAEDIVVKDATTGEVVTDYDITYLNPTTKKYQSTPVATTKGDYDIKLTGRGSYNDDEIKTSYTVGYVADSLAKYVKDNGVKFGGAEADGKFIYRVDGVVPSFVEIGNNKYFADSKKNSISDAKGSYFDVIFPDADECKAVGKYDIKLVGKAGMAYAGQETTVTFEIKAKDMSKKVENTNVLVSKTSTDDYAVSINLTDEDYRLVNDVDYTYKVVPKTAGGVDVVITFKGNYTGTSTQSKAQAHIKENLLLDSDAITAEVIGEYVHTGKMIKPGVDSIIVKEVNGSKETELRYGIDYTIVSYGANVNVGKGTIVLGGVGSYEGTRELTFEIKANASETNGYYLDTTDLKDVYDTGSAFDPAKDVEVKDKDGKEIPVSAYTLKYLRDGKETSDYRSAGTVTMEYTIKTTGAKLTAVYRVATALDTVADIPESFADADYTGSAIEPEVKIVRKNGSVEFVKDTDYTVSYLSNVEIGTGYVVIEGTGDYYGTYIIPFNIVGQMDQNIEVLPAQAKALKTRTLNDKATKVKFSTGKGAKTAVTYTSSDEDVVTVDEDGNIKYTGLGSAKITLVAAETEEYKGETIELEVNVGLKQPTFSPSSKNDAFTVTTSTVKGAEKFQVQYVPTGKSFTSKAAKSKTFTVDKKLVKGRISAANKETYRVRVRAINGDTKSKWSPVKTIATK